MKLSSYTVEHDLTDEQMASLIGASVGAVRKWKSGVRIPRPLHLRRIAEVTNGLVTANDFVEGVPLPSLDAAE